MAEGRTERWRPSVDPDREVRRAFFRSAFPVGLYLGGLLLVEGLFYRRDDAHATGLSLFVTGMMAGGFLQDALRGKANVLSALLMLAMIAILVATAAFVPR
jgi:hypothetical protein